VSTRCAQLLPAAARRPLPAVVERTASTLGALTAAARPVANDVDPQERRIGSRAERNDPPGKLVSQHHREREGMAVRRTVHDVQVRVAQTGRLHLDQDLSRTRPGHRDLPEPGSCPVEHERSHGRGEAVRRTASRRHGRTQAQLTPQRAKYCSLTSSTSGKSSVEDGRLSAVRIQLGMAMSAESSSGVPVNSRTIESTIEYISS